MAVVNLYSADSTTLVGSIDAKYEDSFTLETLEALIDQHHKAGKAFLIARVKTRDKMDIRRTFFSYYCAHQLNKILVKRRGRDIVSRYSRNAPLHALNPLTNSEILGEVYYFKVPLPGEVVTPVVLANTEVNNSTAPADEFAANEPQHPNAATEVELQAIPPPSAALTTSTLSRRAVAGKPKEDGKEDDTSEHDSSDLSDHRERAERNAPLPGAVVSPSSSSASAAGAAPSATPAARNNASAVDENGNYFAVFIGTDYNFVYSPELRAEFDACALTEQDASIVDEGRVMIAGGPPGEETEQDFFNILTRLSPFGEGANGDPFSQVIDVPYSRGVVFGMTAILYILVSFLIFSYAVQQVITPTVPLSSKWYWSVLPFLSFLNDRLVAYLYRSQELRSIVLTKIFLWGFYVLFPVVVFNRNANRYQLSRDILDIVFPVIFLLYSFGYYIFLSSRRRLV